MPSKLGRDVALRLSQSQIYQDYEKAFSALTRLPLSFHPVENWQLAHRGNQYENPFCALISKWNSSCAMCLEAQAEICQPENKKTASTVCLAGLYESAVPVLLGDEVLGYLKMGQVSQKAPTQKKFNSIAQQLVAWGITTDLKQLEEAYFHTSVISKEQYESMLRLLEVFAQHLALTAEQVRMEPITADSPMIARAKEYIAERQDDSVTLAEVSRVVNTSVFHFCKMFKKATGLTFTEYLALVRVGKAKNLLINPHLRISEIAYQVGFNSLTHFNRIFRRVVGRSPTAYRESLQPAAPKARRRP